MNRTTTTTGALPQRYTIEGDRPDRPCSDGGWMRSDEVSSYLEHLESQLEQQQARVSSTLREHARVCNVLVDVAARCPPVVERQTMTAQMEEQMRSEAAAAAAEERDTAYYRLGMERAKAELIAQHAAEIADCERQIDCMGMEMSRVDDRDQNLLWKVAHDLLEAQNDMLRGERDAAQEEAVGQRGLRLSCEDMAQEEIDRWKQEVQMLRDAAQAIVDIGRVDLSLQSYNTVWRAFIAALAPRSQEIQS